MNQEEKKYNWSRREERKNQAIWHTRQMESKFKSEISHSVFKTNEYNEFSRFESGKGNLPEIKIVDKDSVTAVLETRLTHTNQKLCVLNFASFKNPGGKFLEGSLAQEECLCMESTLYNVLSTFKDSFYKNNMFYLNKGMYKNRALYSKDIVFERNGVKTVCDVLTCAAPNYYAANRYQGVSKSENSVILESRIKYVLDVANKENVNVLILGAYGCGVFGQDAKEVASLFKKHLDSGAYKFKEIVFAIPKSEHNDNYQKFTEVF